MMGGLFRRKRLNWARFAAILASASLQVGYGHAADPPPLSSGLSASSQSAFASELRDAIVTNDFALALRLLDGRRELAHDPAAIRLRAQLLASLGRTDEAQAVLESRLSVAPDDALARFQLGEIHFNAERDKAAELAYRLSVAGALDPLRRAIIAGRLAEIRARRDWELTIGASLAPDSNLNSGSSADKVEIFGLPFDLDEDARRRGGVAFSANAGVQRRIRLAEADRLLLGLTSAIIEAPGRRFDLQYVSATVGLEKAWTPQLNTSLEPGVDWTWIGGELLQIRAGITASIESRTVANTVWGAALRAADVEDRQAAARSGESYSLQGVRTRYLTASSLVRTTAMAERRLAQSSSETYSYLRAAHGWLAPLSWSVSAYVEPYVSYRRYEGLNPLFNVTRKDREVGASLRLSKRDWVIRGAFPFVGVSVAKNRSSIPLYSFSRERFEFGFTRQF